ncbi:aminodeoxychorismate synthase component I [Ornithinibacillus contaminans]|uniref:aminodeoxychorismate synthase component I n=1 Tax=Ornithinibacillus contaminans TaxID=694055 RepID=UPI00064E0C2C|nr:aminodeoxychorismate synthase component I [Ornithinibacillus contaminans]
MTQKHNPFLHFDFRNKPITFTDPVAIIQADNLEQVLPAFDKVQEAINNGCYAAGYVSYEAAPAFNHSMKVAGEITMPLLWFGIYNTAVEEKLAVSEDASHTTDWQPKTTIQDYHNAIKQIKAYIRQGDTYQVNYTIRMQSQFTGNPVAFYNHLANSQAANYSAYLDIGDFRILSASPELFFHVKDGIITTKPMKGTVGRGRTADEDKKNADWLYQSEKNRAENVMIVDLLRNDLGMIARPGTVRVPELFSIEKYPTVYQMTSTVTAEIDAAKTIPDIFKALFPCGSITGAPKISTMNIINELETSPRNVYCGAIGYITPENEAIFNVPIRTVSIDSLGKATYGVGGGITWDSDETEEYEEVLTKAKVLTNKQQDFKLLETIALSSGQYLVIENHMNRLERSASYFDFPFDRNSLTQQLTDISKQHPGGKWKVRVLLSKNGTLHVEVLHETSETLDGAKVALAKQPINSSSIFLYHKTTNRVLYENARKAFPDVFDVLLWNEKNELTEFTKGNVVVEIAGAFYTPPVACGLLAGTYRESLLEEGRITERVIKVEELPACSGIWFINSVKEWVEVKLE